MTSIIHAQFGPRRCSRRACRHVTRCSRFLVDGGRYDPTNYRPPLAFLRVGLKGTRGARTASSSGGAGRWARSRDVRNAEDHLQPIPPLWDVTSIASGGVAGDVFYLQFFLVQVHPGNRPTGLSTQNLGVVPCNRDCCVVLYACRALFFKGNCTLFDLFFTTFNEVSLTWSPVAPLLFTPPLPLFPCRTAL